MLIPYSFPANENGEFGIKRRSQNIKLDILSILMLFLMKINQN